MLGPPRRRSGVSALGGPRGDKLVITTSRVGLRPDEAGTYAAIGMAFGAVLVPVVVTLVVAVPWLAPFLP
ncbi:hypothetical protein ABGB16_16150 [Micromonospora sp. B11E3]|uniref:hypothetical protein n=1 Tax=Micromonospora sp. B11E3 TaxID=3153562 RepID=UPI00325E3248